MNYENALALRTSLETGMRIGDVLALEVADLKGRTITYTAQKTGKKGKAVVSVDLANRLRKIAGRRFVFEGRNGKKPRTRQAVWKDVKKATRNIFEENVAPHSARKTFAVEDFQEHGLPHTQKALQHDRTDTTVLYAFSDLLTTKGKKDTTQLDRIEKKIDLLISKLSQML
jgi:integrase